MDEWTAAGNTNGTGPGLNWTVPCWTLAFILALLKPQLHVFLSGTKGNGTLETQGFDSTEIKLLQYLLLPCESQKILFLAIPKATGGGENPFPLVTPAV